MKFTHILAAMVLIGALEETTVRADVQIEEIDEQDPTNSVDD